MSHAHSILVERYKSPKFWHIGNIITLILPFLMATALLVALTTFWIDPEVDQTTKDHGISKLQALAILSIMTLPIILALSWGVVFSLKDVLNRLEKTSKLKRTGLRTLISLWFSALSKVHLSVAAIYGLMGIIFIIVMHFFFPNETIIGISEMAGFAGVAASTLLFSIMVIAYVLLFCFMGYIIFTLPLALILAVILRFFSLKRSSFTPVLKTPLHNP